MAEADRLNEPGDAGDRYDTAALERLARFGGAALLQRMAAMLAVDGPRRVERLRHAAEAGDAAAVAAVLHSLKATAAQLGLAALAACCARAEDLCADGDLAAARGDVERVAAELPVDIEWLRAMSAKAGS